MGLELMLKEYNELRAGALGIIDAAAKDGRSDLNDEEKGKLAVTLEKATSLGDQIKAARENGALLDRIKGLPDLAGSTDDGKGKDEGEPASGAKGDDGKGEPASGEKDGRKYLSPGEAFVRSDQIKALHERFPNGLNERHNVDMPPIEYHGWGIKQLIRGQKALINIGDNRTVDGSTFPTAVQPDWRGIIPPYFQPLTVMDAITVGQTTGETVAFVRELAADRDNNAAAVPEATQSDTSGDEASVKPESGFQFEPKTVSVVTIATWVPATNKALSDIGQLRTLIDAFLTRYLDEELERQILHGTGGGAELDGVLLDDGLTTTTFHTDIFVTIRKAITAVRPFGQPTGILMNPADVETVDLAKDGVERYYGAGPFSIGPRTLWGLPVIESPGTPAGTALLGDLRQIVYYDREATNITVGTINDQFIRNIRTLLAETRGALAVQRPAALTAVPLTASS